MLSEMMEFPEGVRSMAKLRGGSTDAFNDGVEVFGVLIGEGNCDVRDE